MRRSAETALAAALLAAGCATAPALPPKPILEHAREAASYSGRLRVSVKGKSLKGRATALVGFRRPDALRIEIPGPTGLRLVAVTREGMITAVFPADRVVFRGTATPEAFESLLGLRLSPPEVMDLLVGTAPAQARSYQARWGTSLPRAVEATLADGTRLELVVEDAEAGAAIPPTAFDEPSTRGCRPISASEARGLWSGR
jgi:outer membrane lipoprotein-sorting protein